MENNKVGGRIPMALIGGMCRDRVVRHHQTCRGERRRMIRLQSCSLWIAVPIRCGEKMCTYLCRV
jgi:hypothetical protein